MKYASKTTQILIVVCFLMTLTGCPPLNPGEELREVVPVLQLFFEPNNDGPPDQIWVYNDTPGDSDFRLSNRWIPDLNAENLCIDSEGQLVFTLEFWDSKPKSKGSDRPGGKDPKELASQDSRQDSRQDLRLPFWFDNINSILGDVIPRCKVADAGDSQKGDRRDSK